jgi:hypothetical protein
MNPFRNDTAEFFEKAKELGLVDEIDQKLEARKHERRLAVIAKIKQLPTEEQTELPALTKACVAANKALQLAEEAYKAADRNYKELSMRSYGARLQFDGARAALEREAQALAPDFLRTAYEDLGYLDGLVKDRFRFEVEIVDRGWFGRPATQTTSNGDAIDVCRANIKNARERIMAMTLEATDREMAQAETSAIFQKIEKEAYALGVSKETFADRRKPVDVQKTVEDSTAREAVKRRNAADGRRAQLAAISV